MIKTVHTGGPFCEGYGSYQVGMHEALSVDGHNNCNLIFKYKSQKEWLMTNYVTHKYCSANTQYEVNSYYFARVLNGIVH